MNLRKNLTLLAAIGATLVPAAFAGLGHAEKFFLEEAAKAGAKGITMSQQALANLNAPEVRNFAQQMLTEHTRLNSELQALAAQKGVVLVPPDAKTTRIWTEIRPGAEDAYLAEMTVDYKETIDLFEKAAKSQDPDIAAFALKTLPHLREQAEAAKQVKKTN